MDNLTVKKYTLKKVSNAVSYKIDYEKELNPAQLEAVKQKEGSILVIAGAGSGKTESLKELLIYINQTNPKAKVMCITHTNVAVNEILSRTGNAFPVSTIHSFLNSLIKDYKKNIHTVIGELFFVPEFVVTEKTEDISEKDYKKNEHERYKKLYEKYADKHKICANTVKAAIENFDDIIRNYEKERDETMERYMEIVNQYDSIYERFKEFDS